MSKRIGAALLAAGAIAGSGCASATGMMYSDQRLAELTAPQFGVAPGQLTISNRQSTATGSYYDVRLPSGQTTRCFHDGNALGLGLSNPPRCGARLNQPF